MKSEDLTFHSLKAISPIDGRHRVLTAKLSEWFSEYAYHKYRIYLEVEYLIALSENKEFESVRELTATEKDFLRKIVEEFSLEDAQIIQNIDMFGYNGLGPTNHDFKACEYFLKMQMEKSSLKDLLEMVHFGLTTEDANNVAYSCKIRGALKNHYVPAMVELLNMLEELCTAEKNTPMLSKTHGQPATPTTFGKEMANYLERLRKELEFLIGMKLPGKNALYFSQTLNFRSPCYIDDEIEVVGEVIEKSDSTKIITVTTSIFNKSKICLIDGVAKIIVR